MDPLLEVLLSNVRAIEGGGTDSLETSGKDSPGARPDSSGLPVGRLLPRRRRRAGSPAASEPAASAPCDGDPLLAAPGGLAAGSPEVVSLEWPLLSARAGASSTAEPLAILELLLLLPLPLMDVSWAESDICVLRVAVPAFPAEPAVLPAPWASWMAAINSPLRIRAVPVMCIEPASDCNSGSSIPARPVARRRRVAPPAASGSGAVPVSSSVGSLKVTTSQTGVAGRYDGAWSKETWSQ